jgi:hypothetical protein
MSVLKGDFAKPDATLRFQSLYLDGDLDCNAIHARSIIPDPTNDLVCNKLTSNTIDNSGTITTGILSSTTISNSGKITTNYLETNQLLVKVPQLISASASQDIDITNAINYNAFNCLLTLTSPLAINGQVFFSLFLKNYYDVRIKYKATITNISINQQIPPIVINLQTALVNGTDTQLLVALSNASPTTPLNSSATIAVLIEKVFLELV